MSEQVYLRHPQTNEIQTLTDPKSSDLVPYLASGYSQIPPPDQKKEGE